MTEKLIDYRFYNHLNINVLEGHGFQFVAQFVSFSLLFVFIGTVFYILSKRICFSYLSNNKFFIPIVLLSFMSLSLPNGVFSETYKIYEILNAEKKEFNEALKGIGISPNKYITPDQLTAKKGKNIIVISIESLEQGFLNSNFDNITPNLTNLANEWTFYDQMLQNPGGGWTAASLYNHQVGMPAFFKGQGNGFFQGTTNVRLTGLGNILNKAGYSSKYIVGNKEHSGMSDLLNSYGISIVSESNSTGQYHKVKHGLDDYDLFQEAKLQVKKFLKEKDKPFALFLSTVNTHFPDGIYDKRMEKFISKKENKFEFSVSAVDYLINNFISFIEEKKLLKNTAIYIFPDHKMMGSTGPVLDKLRKSERRLYLLTNINENKFHKKTSGLIYQIDLPRMIVDGAEIKTNATFLTDFIKTKDINKFLQKNRVKLTTLNTASISRKNFKHGMSVQIKNNNLSVTSKYDNTNIELSHKKTKKPEIFDLTFNSKMVLLSQRRSKRKNIFDLNRYDDKHNRLHLIIFVTDGKVDKTYLGNKQTVGIYKDGSATKYTEEEIRLIMKSNDFTSAKIKNKDLKQNINYDPSVVSITSSEFITSKKIKSLIKTNGNDFRLRRGLNLLTINHNGDYHVKNFDIHGSKKAANKFLVKIESLIKKKEFWALAAHDAIKTKYPNFQENLSKLNFKLLQTLTGRVAYIAYQSNDGSIMEFTSKTSLTYIIPSYMKHLPKRALTKQQHSKNHTEANVYGKDTNRFIAHAGGQINGLKSVLSG